MPFGTPIPAIDSALRARMAAAASLTSLIASKPSARGGGAAIYADGDVAQGQIFPLITIGAWTQVPSHRLSPGTDGYGWNCTVQIKIIGQRSEAQLLEVLNEIMELFPQGTALTVSGYGSAWTDEWNIQPLLKNINAGMTTLELPAILRVYAHS